jgi:hypothetical protein
MEKIKTEKARQGRPPNATPTVPWELRIPETLAAEVTLLLYDPLLCRPRVGARSDLCNRLLREWVERQRKATPPSTTPFSEGEQP